MKSTFFLLASLALVNAAPQLASDIPTRTLTLPVEPRPTCGPCLNACIIACPVGKNCNCPAVCDPKYKCNEAVYEKREAEASITLPVEPQPTCGPCLNSCIVNCPPGKICNCPAVCDPKYECADKAKREDVVPLPTTTKVVPMPTKIPCGCLNDCVVNCPPGEICKCTKECDPKYFCKDTVEPVDPIKTGQPVVEY